MKRMTFEQSFHCQIQALEKSVPDDGLVRIVGTRRKKPTVWAEDRREDFFITTDQGEHDVFHEGV
jgi:hypothetical protein